MREYRVNKNIERTPQVMSLRMPGLFFFFIGIVVVSIVLMWKIGSVWGILLAMVMDVGAYIWLKEKSSDTNMNIECKEQPKRIEGFRDDEI